jgi:glycosyltransferase involved in cell wall biosynthesis
MRERPSVSLVIPMFNEEENIEHAIDYAVDALERHAGDYEILVVDDA